jgi:hypothetical protein
LEFTDLDPGVLARCPESMKPPLLDPAPERRDRDLAMPGRLPGRDEPSEMIGTLAGFAFPSHSLMLLFEPFFLFNLFIPISCNEEGS